MKKLICYFGLAVTLIAITTPVTAAVKIDGIRVEYQTSTTSTAAVYYQGTPPFSIYRSLDGIEWGSPIVSGLNTYNYKDTGLNNYYNYYYKVQDNDGTSATITAYPPNNNVHGSYGIESSFCGVCHVTHAAAGTYLLVQPTAVALCTTCHDGTQSKYDVRNGKVRLSASYADTSGGPFGPLQTGLPVELAVYEGYQSLSVAAVTYNPTSIHNLGILVSQAPGGVSDRNGGLGCVDCHDPHGNSGNFRNLKSVIEVTYNTSVSVNFRAFAKSDPTLTSGYGEDITYDTGSIFFCSACHSDYNQPSGSGNTAATTTQVPGLSLSAGSMNKFIHAVNTPLIFRGEYYTSSLPLETGTGVNVVVCLTCHQAHGTFKTGKSKITDSSALIRMDRQAVCEECHKK